MTTPAHQLHAIKAFDDNYIWLIIKDQQAIIIDPGQDTAVTDYLNDRQINPVAILITHHHDDHIGGVAALRKRYPDITVYAHNNHNVNADTLVDEGSIFHLLNLDFQVWQTAGHTDTHLSYLCQIAGRTQVFCGDTLFKAGCGRIFTGTVEQMYDSFARYQTLPDDTIFYPAHEYTLSNLKFAQFLEPNNADIAKQMIDDAQLRADDLPTLPTTLANEKKINPFFAAFNPSDELLHQAKQNGFLGHADDDLALFAFLRELKNRF